MFIIFCLANLAISTLYPLGNRTLFIRAYSSIWDNNDFLGPKTNALAQTDSELSKNYQFWIRAEYDSYGVLSVTSNSGYGYSDFYPQSVLAD